MLVLEDQIGNKISLGQSASRIVSLVPSITELLAYLQMDDQVMAITKFCVHPDNWFNSKTRIGGTKNPRLQDIIKLNPDLIIANKEENRKEDIEYLKQYSQVYVSDVVDMAGNLKMIADIGILTGKTVLAEELLSGISKALQDLPIYTPSSALYFIWKSPWLSVGADTFIHHMMQLAGFSNLLAAQTRYPEADIKNWNLDPPEYVLLSSEPYPFTEKHISEVQEIFPNSKIILVNGEYFSWYGSRVLMALELFKQRKFL